MINSILGLLAQNGTIKFSPPGTTDDVEVKVSTPECYDADGRTHKITSTCRWKADMNPYVQAIKIQELIESHKTRIQTLKEQHYE